MMKKTVAGILTASFILGAGNLAFAQTNESTSIEFDQMKPYMENMYPNVSEQELNEMFTFCHSENGMMQNFNGE